ncbi:DUF4329 domain-containing protein [Loktanella salsilacus]|uniref:DUF4329 domain-containing protein n=1 Tax=Loktanella salsilacus TaxID=195913 RepID=UPI0020B79236|nr:DUF4329 domain-containing protein [Loktanella salsilacus]UTH48519.1 DUF4329 domain-containing protein [Loktanella salsilacus]
MLRYVIFLPLLLAAPATAQDAQELALARTVLSDLQTLSFKKKREYCGYLGLTRDGTLISSDPVVGDMASCAARFPDDIAVIASYHTHGTFDEGYFNEMPSTIDVESDSAAYMNGYVATPGGRLWFINGRTRVSRQICGLGCLPVAPQFRKEADGEVAEEYTFEALRRHQR